MSGIRIPTVHCTVEDLNNGQLNKESILITDLQVCYSDGLLVRWSVSQMICDSDAWSLFQWGSEIWTRMDFRWSKRGWVLNGLDFEWDLKSGNPTI